MSKPSLQDTISFLSAEAERNEVWAGTAVGPDARAMMERRSRMLTQAADTLDLVRQHQDDFAKLVRSKRGAQ